MATTIQESFTLPSKGLVYSQQINPKITLRSMTGEEEMLRLSPSDSEYEVIAQVIDACIKEELPISSYDMCLGDFQYLLTRLWEVSYGKEYKIVIQCPNCNEITEAVVNLDKIELHELEDGEFNLDSEIELPVSKHKVRLTLQTPRLLDIVKEKAKNQRIKMKNNYNYELMFSAMSLISDVDGKTQNEMSKEAFVKKLPVKDVYYIINKGDELNRKVGLDNSVIAKCSHCNYMIVTNFRLDPKFYGPQNS